MSPSIWTRCAGSSSVRRVEARPWRIVESQHVASTRKLVDSDAEHELLERLIDESKPSIPDSPELEGLHWLLFTPFRYPPLRHGSRFGRARERGLWYGSEELETALAEAAYYRLLLFEGSKAELAPHTASRSAFQAHVRTRSGVDLTTGAFQGHRAQLASKSDYAATQQLGSDMRADGVEAFRYTSARDRDEGVNIGVFTPAAFARKEPLGVAQTWLCTITASHDVAFDRANVGDAQRVFFSRSEFLFDGALPAPAM